MVSDISHLIKGIPNIEGLFVNKVPGIKESNSTVLDSKPDIAIDGEPWIEKWLTSWENGLSNLGEDQVNNTWEPKIF